MNAEQQIALYKEVCINIRETDAISFKLLRATPLFAGFGSGVLTYFLSADNTPNGAAVIALCLLSVVGLGLTLGLFVWERRNLQKCNWFIERAKELEQCMIDGTPPTSIQYIGWDEKKSDGKKDDGKKEDKKNGEDLEKDRPKLFFFGIEASKTKAENIVYMVSIFAWLVPIITYCITNFSICFRP